MKRFFTRIIPIFVVRAPLIVLVIIFMRMGEFAEYLGNKVDDYIPGLDRP